MRQKKTKKICCLVRVDTGGATGNYTPAKRYRNADRVPKKVEGDIDWGKVVSV